MSGDEKGQAVWPKGLSNPAISALEHAGYRRLEDLTSVSEKTILSLHGMGPKGVRILREALHQQGLSFAPNSPK